MKESGCRRTARSVAPNGPAEETIAMTLRAGKYPAFAQPNCSESQAMSADKHHQIWIEQCEAARTIRERYGLEAAFDYVGRRETDKFRQRGP